MEQDSRELDARYYMPAFSRTIKIVRGEGSRVWDDRGREYIDCVAGIAVCSTGHCHPKVVRARQLIHCSNLYYVPNQAELAERLVEITGLAKAFFSNSGAEANEGAIKLARIRTGRNKFVAFTHGFHGRTCGSLAITHKPAIREPFEPLSPPCTFVDYGDLDALAEAVGEDTAGVFVESIQGEAGVLIPPDGFLQGIREICDDFGALMIVDEVPRSQKGLQAGFPSGRSLRARGWSSGRVSTGAPLPGARLPARRDSRRSAS